MKKMLIVLSLVLSLLIVGNVFANPQPKDGAGWYVHSVTGNVKYFKNGHPGEPSQWEFIGEENPNPQPCGDCPGDQTAELTITGQAVKTDVSHSETGWWGNYNDKAHAEATGYGGFNMELYANADGKTLEIVGWKRVWFFHVPIFDLVPNPADVEGFGFGKGYANAWSYALDFGRTSMSGAGAYSGGKAFVHGEATGIKGCQEFIIAELWIGGSVSQWNQAGETGYSNGQFVDGGNSSFASGLGNTFLNDTGQTYSILGFELGGAELTGYVKNGHLVSTQGSTFVTIDPYGSYRSFYGTTQNSASVNFGCKLNPVNSAVGGTGGIAGMVNNGVAYAGGQATFDYSGSTNGAGNATINGTIQPGTVFVSGSAHAVGD
jgi:hypothetical protein